MTLCNKVNPTYPNETCVGDAGHRGRHAYRATIPVSSIPGMTEGASAVAARKAPPSSDDGSIDPTDAEQPPEAYEEIEHGWSPGSEVMINLKGKLYLPARRRVQWMRGAPIPHPDWTIDTEIEQHIPGKFIRPGRVEGGYAVVRGNVFDEDGRLIATGLKTEYSENFSDYLEKAETGAIARALAVAGYGTESALDFDEGIDKDRIADSPVEAPAKPIAITSSSVPGVGRGGKTLNASVAQIRRVSELSRAIGIGPIGLVTVIEQVFDTTLPDMPSDEKLQSMAIATFLSAQPGEMLGRLILTLESSSVPA